MILDARSAQCVVLLSLASCLEMTVGERKFGMRTWRVGDLGLVATSLRNVGMRAWRVEFALSVTLV